MLQEEKVVLSSLHQEGSVINPRACLGSFVALAGWSEVHFLRQRQCRRTGIHEGLMQCMSYISIEFKSLDVGSSCVVL